MARPSIAIVGTGSMGSLHARVLHDSARADLAVVVESQEHVGRAVAGRHGAAWVPSLDDLPAVDAVVIAAATPAHHALPSRPSTPVSPCWWRSRSPTT